MPSDIQSLWVELGPSGVAIVRAITTRADCPLIDLGTHSQRMDTRAPADSDSFGVRVCETIAAPGTPSAAVESQALAMPRPDPRRIVVIGDTGCRLKRPDAFQACNDPQAWPFAAIARAAARWQPDLVIHVGDYHYREAECPAGDAGCAGSPSADKWEAWRADFFAPAAELLRAAPWVMARGNHEACSRAGRGWFRFLDPQLPASGCRDYTTPYATGMGELQLLVLDTAILPNTDAPADMVASYAPQFDLVRQQTHYPTWLIMHHPLWGVGQVNDPPEGPRQFQQNPTLQAASANDLGPAVSLVISGHVHLFEVLSFADGRPPQLIVGQGGTALDPAVTLLFVGTEVAGSTVAQGITLDRFGFTTLELGEQGWMATARDVDGHPLVQCRLARNGTSCGE